MSSTSQPQKQAKIREFNLSPGWDPSGPTTELYWIFEDNPYPEMTFRTFRQSLPEPQSR